MFEFEPAELKDVKSLEERELLTPQNSESEQTPNLRLFLGDTILLLSHRDPLGRLH